MVQEPISSAEMVISEACNHLEILTPNSVWKAVCAAILNAYPIDHPAWTYGWRFPCRQTNITYSLVSFYSKKTIRSWIGIERCAYDIAQASAAFDKRPSEIAEALRSTYAIYFKPRPTRTNGNYWNSKKFTICKLCWRLAPLDFKSNVCDKHKARTPEYQKAYRHLSEAEEAIKTMLLSRPYDRELINIIFPTNLHQKADNSPEILLKLAQFFPFAFTYISKQGKDPTNIRQLIEGLVGEQC